jgi:diphthamide synthase subunit DPH2
MTEITSLKAQEVALNFPKSFLSFRIEVLSFLAARWKDHSLVG